MKWLLLLLLPFSALSHPGTGIVKDSRNNIYYTDLQQVWKITTEGKRSVVVPGVHTHELFMDANDVLYGENSMYHPATESWSCFVWKWNSKKGFDTVVGNQPGFLSNYSFVRDRGGNMYWVERFKTTRFRKKSPAGKITTIAEGKFGRINWLFANDSGDVYFVHEGNLNCIRSSGKLQLIAKDVAKNKGDPSGRNATFGIWTDKKDQIYLADYTESAVKKVSRNGAVSTFFISPENWGPTGGVFDHQGNLWLLECSHQNEIRVRKIPPSDFSNARKSSFFPGNGLSEIFLVIILLFGCTLLAGRMYLKKGQAV